MGEGPLRIPDVTRGEPVTFTFDGVPVDAFAGETIGAALLAGGRRALRSAPRTRAPRGLFCVMGVCFDCVVWVDGTPGVRSCVTPVRAGLRVTSGG